MQDIKKIKISIIFPIYNNENSIEKCIRSVMNQTLKEIELILIDDGSTGRTPEICDKLAEEDDRIRVIHKSNAGSAAGRNQGIDLARGEYIAFVESDDFVLADTYMKLYNCAKKNDADIVKCGFYYYEKGETSEETCFYELAKEDEVFAPKDKPPIFLCHASIWAGCYRRDFLNQNNLRFIETPSATYSDFSWMAMTYAFARRVIIYHEALYNYTYDNPNSSRVQQGEKCFYKPYHCLMANKILREAKMFDSVKEEIGCQEYRTCFVHARNIKQEYRDEYFDKYRDVLCDLCQESFSFKKFFFWEKRLAKLLLNDNKKRFYKKVDRINSLYNFFGNVGVTKRINQGLRGAKHKKGRQNAQ